MASANTPVACKLLFSNLSLAVAEISTSFSVRVDFVDFAIMQELETPWLRTMVVVERLGAAIPGRSPHKTQKMLSAKPSLAHGLNYILAVLGHLSSSPLTRGKKS